MGAEGGGGGEEGGRGWGERVGERGDGGYMSKGEDRKKEI